MIERVQTFGDAARLVGIVTEPEPEARADRPAVILSDVGLQHRVGPFRIWVDLARQLAALGFPVLRFDLSGQGDSGPSSDTRSGVPRAVAEVRQAMDHLERTRGVRRFVVIGFCSGTDSAHGAALADPRVVGVAWIEGYAYRSARFRLHWYTARLVEPRRWRVLVERVRRWVAGRGRRARPEIFQRTYPRRRELTEQLEHLLARGVRMFVAYTGGAQVTYGYAGQFFDMLPGSFRGRVEELYLPRADHLLTDVPERRRAIDAIVAWADEAFPGRIGAGGLDDRRSA